MTFACPKCGDDVRLSQAACNRCGFQLTVGAVVAFYWQGLRRGAQERAAWRCAACGQPAPINAAACPHCKTPITVDSTVHAVLDPPRQRWRNFLTQATPETRRRFQWAYLLASGLVLWWMLADLEKKQTGELFRDALLSVVYCAAVAFIVLLLVPRWIFQLVAQGTTAIVKLALILNYLTLVLVLQSWISAWWARASILAGVFAVSWLAVWLIATFLWPMKNELHSLGAPPNPRRNFNPSAPQGRVGRID
jgi:hypothetical protein